jgi:hypothetical protein
MTQLEEGNTGSEEEGAASGTVVYEAPKQHNERLAFLTELLADEDLVMTTINAPPSGTDTRDVKHFSLFGYWWDAETIEQRDLMIDTAETYKLHCSPFDPSDA